MTDKLVPTIAPIKVKEYEVNQRSKLPVRSILLASSGGGKGVLLQNMILDIYRNCFERVYIFSPSIHVDQTWEPVKEYLAKHVNLNGDEPESY